jgi:hypothetical protein
MGAESKLPDQSTAHCRVAQALFHETGAPQICSQTRSGLEQVEQPPKDLCEFKTLRKTTYSQMSSFERAQICEQSRAIPSIEGWRTCCALF